MAVIYFSVAVIGLILCTFIDKVPTEYLQGDDKVYFHPQGNNVTDLIDLMNSKVISSRSSDHGSIVLTLGIIIIVGGL